MEKHRGYECDFIDKAQSVYSCGLCQLVARAISLTSCCSRSCCQGCIEAVKGHDEPCPFCGQESFGIVEAATYREDIRDLKVLCSMKDKGCAWSGKLCELDAHLDSKLDNCLFIGVQCPLNCDKVIAKTNLQNHIEELCAKREVMCQYCDFEATYEEVIEEHLLVCQYVLIPCPNGCGETHGRDEIKSHLKVCQLEVVNCEFNSVGCDGRFKREEQEQHSMQNLQKHVFLTASVGVDENRKLKEKIQQQEWKMYEQDLMISKLKKELAGQTILASQLQEITKTVESLSTMVLKRSFVMKDFEVEKSKDKVGDWRSAPMYTHICGYKFCIGIEANGRKDARGHAITVYFESMKGEYDHMLKWPARVKFTLELINQMGGENFRSTRVREWNKPIYLNCFEFYFESRYDFISHADLEEFLHDNTLYFNIFEVTVQ